MITRRSYRKKCYSPLHGYWDPKGYAAREAEKMERERETRLPTERELSDAIDDLRDQAEMIQKALDQRVARMQNNQENQYADRNLPESEFVYALNMLNKRLDQLEKNLAKELDKVGENVYNNIVAENREMVDCCRRTEIEVNTIKNHVEQVVFESKQSVANDIVAMELRMKDDYTEKIKTKAEQRAVTHLNSKVIVSIALGALNFAGILALFLAQFVKF